MIEQRVVAFDPAFERARAIHLRADAEDKRRFNAYARRQVETHLGERFNVLLSTTRYEIRGGQIFGENMDEPFIDVLIKGRNYRRLHGNPVDFAREEAEVYGFAKIESAMTAPDAKKGLMMASVSQPGNKEEIPGQPESIYQHNFYDVFTLKEDEKGKYVEARRYSSGLSLSETTEKLKTAGLLAPDANPTVEEFLANPIKIDPEASLFDSADRLHAYLHREHQYLPKQIHDEALKMVQTLIAGYASSLEKNPWDVSTHNLYLNAILNGFDLAVETLSEEGSSSENILRAYALQMMLSSKDSVNALGTQKVREVDTGCGFSGGFSTDSAFSVSEFGLEADDYGKRTFNCPNTPACGKLIVRPKNKLLANCPHCGANVSC